MKPYFITKKGFDIMDAIVCSFIAFYALLFSLTACAIGYAIAHQKNVDSASKINQCKQVFVPVSKEKTWFSFTSLLRCEFSDK